MKKKTLVWVSAILVLFIAGAFILATTRASSFETVSNFNGEITIYKSGSCGCCGVYSNYFKNKGNSDVRTVNLEDVETFKRQYGIPARLESCHTTIIGDYFVEGHVPLEAVEKLLTEKPDIKGLAMSGMPSGSPGMPGAKSGEFVIYAINKDGTYNEFMRI